MPGRTLTRHVAASAQVLFSSLLIHLSGGRIETHFHVFGSLAFIAFYRDWKVLLAPTAVIAIDHLWRGLYWPQSVFGVLTPSAWRAFEHAGWVLFEDVFLGYSCVLSLRDMRAAANREAELLKANALRSDLISRIKTTTTALNQFGIVTETDPKGKITYVNDKFCEITQYSRDDVIGKTHRVLNSGHHDKAFFQDMYATISSGRVWRGEIKNRAKDGSYFWVDTAIVPFTDDSGAIEKYMAIRVDVTDLEEARSQAESASKIKSEFLATMSHELRTPLNGVIGMIELLLSTDLESKQKRYTWLAKTSADALLTLINDTLDFAKIESGKLHLETIDFDLWDSIAVALDSFSTQCETKGIELASRIHPGVPRRVIGDSGRLQQILRNLVGNAVKFTDSGYVDVRVELESADPDGSTIRFVVTDTGIGIDGDKMQTLFSPFTQADSSMSRKYGGTGLGLAISSNLVQLMGGTIDATSKVGHGSTFAFSIRAGKSDVYDQEFNELKKSLAGIRVLGVDDNAINRELLHELFGEWKIWHRIADDGASALQLLRQAEQNGKPFDLVITDMQMPEMTGCDLAEAIRDDPSLQNIRLILLTSSHAAPDSETLGSLGFSSAVYKPVRQSSLIHSMCDALGCGDAVSAAERASTAWAEDSTSPDSPKHQILLAEDDEISGEVAKEVLLKAGFMCEHVKNGQDAFVAATTGQFDLALMDCHMPELDGFDSTRQIRAHEDAHGCVGRNGARLPVIALTANALAGDRDRCLDAGMDDYVTKPFVPDYLIATIRRHLAGCRQSERLLQPLGEIQVGGVPDSCAIDVESLLDRWGGMHELLTGVLDKFETEAQAAMAELTEAVGSSDRSRIREIAHKLKGASGYAGASHLQELALQMEQAVDHDGTDSLGELLSAMQSATRDCIDGIPAARRTIEEDRAGSDRRLSA
ncbi:MAG: response regulator [Phycisphaerales bacterium JB043]